MVHRRQQVVLMGLRRWVGLHLVQTDRSLTFRLSRDFSRYDEQTNTIQAVGLVKARKGQFNICFSRCWDDVC